MLRLRLINLFKYVLVLGLVSACGGEEKVERPNASPSSAKAKQEETKKIPEALPAAVQTAKAAPVKRSVRLEREPWRPLLEEASRAELNAQGLVVDLGAADQLKYTLGGWKNGWGKPQTNDAGLSYAAVEKRKVPLRLLVRDAIDEVVLRIRGKGKGQFIGVMVDGKERGNAAVPKEWTTLRVPLRRGKIEAGWQVVDLIFRTKGQKGVRADIDWVWLKSGSGEQPPLLGPRVLPLSIGGRTKRALTAPTPRDYSFFLHVPEKASLVFDYGSAVQSTFKVFAQTADGKRKEIFNKASVANSWTEGDVDLAAYAGKAIRLDLVTEGDSGVVGWGEPEIMQPMQAVSEELPPGSPAKNIVVILMDTARYDAYKVFNKDSIVQTPYYDAMTKEGTVFKNAYNNENWTKPSVATVLSGLYPITHGAKTHETMLSQDVELISERLRKNGFATSAFIANGYCGKEFGFGQGWDAYRNYIRENRKSEAEYVYRDALAWIDKIQKKDASKRFFTYLQTIDPHVTYKVDKKYTDLYHPKPYKGRVGPTLDGFEQADYSKGKKKIGKADYEWITALYRAELTYHDEQMGLFIQALKDRGILDDTILVITNDHGEELNEHGRLGHGHSLYEHMIRAPLLMRYPKTFKAGALVEEVVEHVDLFPTMLEVLGLPPSKHVDGQSLMPLIRNEPISRPGYAVTEFVDNRYAVRVGNWKMMLSSGDWGGLYNLKDDIEENHDLSKKRPIARKLCEVYLSEALSSTAKSNRRKLGTQQRRFKGGNANMDPELKRQLEALGYFGE